MTSLVKRISRLSLIGALTGLATAANATVLFSDDFESGSLSKTLGSARWGDQTYVGVSSDRAVSGKYAAKFTFSGNSSPSEDADAELRFDMGSLQKEVWFQYKLFVPSNYSHRDADGPDNNKFLRLWGNTYDDVEKIGLSMWRSSTGLSSLQADWNVNGAGTGPNGNSFDGFISSSDLGKWMTIKIYVQAPTSTTKGTLKLWKNGQLVINNAGTMNSYWGSDPHAYRYGYFLGWSNSGFAQTTYMYIDDVVIATQESDLGSSTTTQPSNVSPPAAPVLKVN